MRQDYRTRVSFQCSDEDWFRVWDCPCGCTGGDFIDSDDLVTPVEQKDLELLDELDLVLIPVLFEDFINVSRSGDWGVRRLLLSTCRIAEFLLLRIMFFHFVLSIIIRIKLWCASKGGKLVRRFHKGLLLTCFSEFRYPKKYLELKFRLESCSLF